VPPLMRGVSHVEALRGELLHAADPATRKHHSLSLHLRLTGKSGCEAVYADTIVVLKRACKDFGKDPAGSPRGPMAAFGRRIWLPQWRKVAGQRPSARVKGCPTPARAKRLAAAGSELRAGVGQASREETAGHTAVAGLMLNSYGDLSVGSGAGNGDAGDEPMRSVDKASISAAKRCAVDGVGERGTA
jgi:hypothetical protein